MTHNIKVCFINYPWVGSPYVTSATNSENPNLLGFIAIERPDVIVSYGEVPEQLNNAHFELRKKWLHFIDPIYGEEMEKAIEHCYYANLWDVHPNQHLQPLVSVYTATYNPGGLILDTYKSLAEQSYTNWEWVVVDDGSCDRTFERVSEIARKDSRVRSVAIPYCGKIGALKDVATRLCNGDYLVEVDHDDMLTDNALAEIVTAFQDPGIGMVYGNFTEFYEDGRPDNEYKDSFWSGRYRDTEYRGRIRREARAPNIYGRWGPNYQDRHAWYLTTGPNHPRAYRKSELVRLGGYNRNLPVADDWDLFYRFFLFSKCRHIDKLLYLYRLRNNQANTTFTKNQSIQDHLTLCRAHYAKQAELHDLTSPKYEV